MWKPFQGFFARTPRLKRCDAALSSVTRCVHSFPEHPHKTTVVSLLHQRPFQRVELPSLISSMTLMQPQIHKSSTSNDCTYGSAVYASTPEQYNADYNHLSQLCKFFHTPPPPHGSTFFTTDLGGACKMRWERHTEVQTYTFVRSATDDEIAKPFADSSVALGVIPRGWVAALPGLVLASVHVAMLPNAPSDFAALAQHFHRHDRNIITGCSVDGGRFRVYSDWRTHSDGFGRIIVHGLAGDQTPNRRTAAGKVLQRLIELDKYRALTLLAYSRRVSNSGLSPEDTTHSAPLISLNLPQRSVLLTIPTFERYLWKGCRLRRSCRRASIHSTVSCRQ